MCTSRRFNFFCSQKQKLWKLASWQIDCRYQLNCSARGNKRFDEINSKHATSVFMSIFRWVARQKLWLSAIFKNYIKWEEKKTQAERLSRWHKAGDVTSIPSHQNEDQWTIEWKNRRSLRKKWFQLCWGLMWSRIVVRGMLVEILIFTCLFIQLTSPCEGLTNFLVSFFVTSRPVLSFRGGIPIVKAFKFDHKHSLCSNQLLSSSHMFGNDDEASLLSCI